MDNYELQHGFLKNVGSAIKNKVSKLKGTQKKNHKYLRRELMPNGKYKYTYKEDIDDDNKYAYNNKYEWGEYNPKGSGTSSIKDKSVTVEKKYYGTNKKIKGKKYTYKELTSKGWKYYYENKSETLKNLNRAKAMAETEHEHSKEAEGRADRNRNRVLSGRVIYNGMAAGPETNSKKKTGIDAKVHELAKKKADEAWAKASAAATGSYYSKEDRGRAADVYSLASKLAKDWYVSNDDIAKHITKKKRSSKKKQENTSSNSAGKTGNSVDKTEKGRRKNRVTGKGKIKVDKTKSYKKKRVYSSKTLRKSLGKSDKDKWTVNSNPTVINTKKDYRRW